MSVDYQSVQRQLKRFASAMDRAALSLGTVALQLKDQGEIADEYAEALDQADGDPRYVEMTRRVATTAHVAVKATRRAKQAAQDTADAARAAKAQHRRKYGELDELRRNRPTRTPRPGFFAED